MTRQVVRMKVLVGIRLFRVSTAINLIFDDKAKDPTRMHDQLYLV
jgi:hypothetical protein